MAAFNDDSLKIINSLIDSIIELIKNLNITKITYANTSSAGAVDPSLENFYEFYNAHFNQV